MSVIDVITIIENEHLDSVLKSENELPLGAVRNCFTFLWGFMILVGVSSVYYFQKTDEGRRSVNMCSINIILIIGNQVKGFEATCLGLDPCREGRVRVPDANNLKVPKSLSKIILHVLIKKSKN